MPISLLLPYNFRIKGITILVAFTYLLFVLFKKTDVKFRLQNGIQWAAFFKRIAVQGTIIAVITTIFVWIMLPNALFCVPRSNLRLFVIILFVYTFLSVWPQEVIYRTFYFERYQDLFPSRKLLIFINALVFSLAHVMFRNTLVLVLTFIGGLLFAYTYVKTKSTVLVSIEHALYGNWLFTVGMGEMLAFPGQEACG
jgi:membrane protease YdiL (CAAX protease family)